MRQEYSWLELRPQQKFGDDGDDLVVDIIRHVSELGFFVICENDSIKVVVRARKEEQDHFQSVPGITPVISEAPKFDGMVLRRVVPRERNSMVPLVDLRKVTRSRVYQKMWALRRDCIMACFFSNRTRQVLGSINARIRALETVQRNGGLSGRKKSDLDWAIKKRDGNHSFYSCLVFFGARAQKGDQGPEDAVIRLGSGMLLNSFAHRYALRRAEFSSKRTSLLEKITAKLGGPVTVDPETFVPSSSGGTMTLAETELAYFISLPEGHDVRTINFGMGSTPTFVHGMTHEVGKTDLTSDFNP